MNKITLKTDIFVKWDFIKPADIEHTLDMGYDLWTPKGLQV